MSKTPIISIVAKSGTGKTTLLEKLIKELKNRGVRLAVLKHTHSFDIDKEGKDTWRLARAGADTVAISSQDKFALIEARQTELTIDEIADRIQNVDIILTEGYKKGDKPKIEVFRSDVCKELVCKPNELIAIVSDIPWKVGVPFYHLDDTVGVANEIVKYIESYADNSGK
jgi:molybdopterin-guanine dinucleotide biosynthesis protein MobB